MLALTAIHEAKKQGQTPELSQHFSQKAYNSAFSTIDVISKSDLPRRVKSRLLAMVDDCYAHVIKAKDLSPFIGRHTAKTLAKSMASAIVYLEKSLDDITDEYTQSVSLWRNIPVYDYWYFCEQMRRELKEVHNHISSFGYWATRTEEAEKEEDARFAREAERTKLLYAITPETPKEEANSIEKMKLLDEISASMNIKEKLRAKYPSTPSAELDLSKSAYAIGHNPSQ